MHELYIYKKILIMQEMLDSPWLSFDLEVSDSVFMAANAISNSSPLDSLVSITFGNWEKELFNITKEY